MLLGCSQVMAEELTLENAGAVLLRSGQLSYEAVTAGRQWAQDLERAVNVESNS